MHDDERMGPNNRLQCVCVKKDTTDIERTDDGKFHLRPHMVGNSILLYGRKNSRWPMQAFIGPEWPCMVFTNMLIIVPSYFFLVNVAAHWHPAVMVLGIITTTILLCSFLCTACTDPGIVWIDKEDEETGGGDTQLKTREEKLESGQTPPIGTSQVKGKLIMCGTCRIDRPVTAKHCYECGVCVNELDHHCPWTGKCIAKKNLTTFYAFLWSLVLQLIFVISMVIASSASEKPVT